MPCKEIKKKSNMKLLNRTSNRTVSVDLKTTVQIPVHIIETEMRPDIVEWSDSIYISEQKFLTITFLIYEV